MSILAITLVLLDVEKLKNHQKANSYVKSKYLITQVVVDFFSIHTIIVCISCR